MSGMFNSTVKNFNPFNASMSSMTDIGLSDEIRAQNLLGGMMKGYYDKTIADRVDSSNTELRKYQFVSPNVETEYSGYEEIDPSGLHNTSVFSEIEQQHTQEIISDTSNDSITESEETNNEIMTPSKIIPNTQPPAIVNTRPNKSTTATESIYDQNIYGTLVGRSVEDFYEKSANGASLYTTGSYDISMLTDLVKKSTGSTKRPSLFILPNTRVELIHESGKKRVVENEGKDNDLIYVDTTNVKSISVSKMIKKTIIDIDKQTKSVEMFNVDCYGVSFSFFDLLVLVLIGMIIYYMYVNKTK
jgi:hypothetical protein